MAMAQINASPQLIAKVLVKHGYAMVEPPHEVRACFDEIKRCSTLLRRNRPNEHEIRFRSSIKADMAVNASNQFASSSHDPSRRRVLRACAVQGAINAAWAKATNSSKPFDVSCANAGLLSYTVELLKDQFEWIEEQDLTQHPTIQALAEHIKRVESARREFRSLIWEDRSRNHHAEVQHTRVPTHTDLRCLETRMQWCGQRACSLLDNMCREVLCECLPDIDNLLGEKSPLQPSLLPSQLGSMLTLLQCRRRTEGSGKAPMDQGLGKNSVSMVGASGSMDTSSCIAPLSLENLSSSTGDMSTSSSGHKSSSLIDKSLLPVDSCSTGRSSSSGSKSSSSTERKPSSRRDTSPSSFDKQSSSSTDKSPSSVDQKSSDSREKSPSSADKKSNSRDNSRDKSPFLMDKKSLNPRDKSPYSMDTSPSVMDKSICNMSAASLSTPKAVPICQLADISMSHGALETNSQSGSQPSRSSRKLSSRRKSQDSVRSSEAMLDASCLEASSVGEEVTCCTEDTLDLSRGLLSVFYSWDDTMIELQDRAGSRTVRYYNSQSGKYINLALTKNIIGNSLVFLVGRTLEAATTVNSIGMHQSRQKLFSHRVIMPRHLRGAQPETANFDCSSFAYELHAHPKTLLDPEEYGRVALGKSTPPLFREAFRLWDYYSKDPAGRSCADRIVRLNVFPEHTSALTAVLEGRADCATESAACRADDAAMRHQTHTSGEETYGCSSSNGAAASSPGRKGSRAAASNELGCGVASPTTQSSSRHSSSLPDSHSPSRRSRPVRLSATKRSRFAYKNASATPSCVGETNHTSDDSKAEELLVAVRDVDVDVDSDVGCSAGAAGHPKDIFSGKERRKSLLGYLAVHGACLARLDIALLIMYNLDVATLCRASMVCQTWQKACYSPSLWRHSDLSKCAAKITDRALAQLSNRLRFAKTLDLSGCELITDCGVEALLSDGCMPFRRGEKENWEREAPEHKLQASWYGRELLVKGHRFRIYGFGKDEVSGRSYVRGRTSFNEEVRMGLDHVRSTLSNGSQESSEAGGLSLCPAPSACPVHSPVYMDKCEDCNKERVRPSSAFTRVLIHGCKLITIRGARMLEGASTQVEGFPGPVTICVEAEGDIARRRLIFFKIRGNQPLKRLLRAYLASAFLTNPETPLVFYFNDEVVYAHDTAQSLGLRESDVVKAALPYIRIRVYVGGTTVRRQFIEVSIRASERIIELFDGYKKRIGANIPVVLSSCATKIVPIPVHATPVQLGWGDGHAVWAFNTCNNAETDT